MAEEKARIRQIEPIVTEHDLEYMRRSRPLFEALRELDQELDARVQGTRLEPKTQKE